MLVTHSDTRLMTPEPLTPHWEVGPRADDVLLCVSELSTNAVLHGVPPGHGFRLRLTLHRDGSSASRSMTRPG